MFTSATLFECRNGWRFKLTFTDGRTVSGGGFGRREEALRVLEFVSQISPVRTAETAEVKATRH